MILVRPSGSVMLLPAQGDSGLTRQFLRSTLRVSVAFASLSAGQWLVGQRDPGEIFFRAATGALLTEGTALALRAIEPPPDAPEPLDLALLLSYGNPGAQALETALRDLHLRLVPRVPEPVPRPR